MAMLYWVITPIGCIPNGASPNGVTPNGGRVDQINPQLKWGQSKWSADILSQCLLELGVDNFPCFWTAVCYLKQTNLSVIKLSPPNLILKFTHMNPVAKLLIVYFFLTL